MPIVHFICLLINILADRLLDMICVWGCGWVGACFALFYVFLRHVYLLESRAP